MGNSRENSGAQQSAAGPSPEQQAADRSAEADPASTTDPGHPPPPAPTTALVPPSPAPWRRWPRPRRLGTIAPLAAFLLCGGGVGMYLGADGGAGAGPPAEMPALSEDGAGDDAPVIGPQEGSMTESWATEPTSADGHLGAWLTDEALVTVTENGVTGHHLDTGEPVWTVDPPDGAGAPCGASPDTNEAGVGAVLFPETEGSPPETAEGCSQLAAVDTAAREVRWEIDLGELDAGGIDDASEAVATGPTIVVEMADGERIYRFGVEDGAVAEPLAPGPDCFEDADYAVGQEHIAALVGGACADSLGIAAGVVVYDLATGDVSDRYPYDQLSATVNDVNAVPLDDPLLVEAHRTGGPVTFLRTTDGQMSAIGESQGGWQVVGDTLVHAARTDNRSQAHSGAVRGYALSDGEELWDHRLDGETVLVGGTDAYGLIATVDNRDLGHWVQLLRVADGEEPVVEGTALIPRPVGRGSGAGQGEGDENEQPWLASDDERVYIAAADADGARMVAYERNQEGE